MDKLNRYINFYKLDNATAQRLRECAACPLAQRLLLWAAACDHFLCAQVLLRDADPTGGKVA